MAGKWQETHIMIMQLYLVGLWVYNAAAKQTGKKGEK